MVISYALLHDHCHDGLHVINNNNSRLTFEQIAFILQVKT